MVTTSAEGDDKLRSGSINFFFHSTSAIQYGTYTHAEAGMELEYRSSQRDISHIISEGHH